MRESTASFGTFNKTTVNFPSINAEYFNGIIYAFVTEDQIIRFYFLVTVGILFFLFFAARKNYLIVYRDYKDLSWSISILATPLISMGLLLFIAGENTQITDFIHDTILGKAMLVIALLVFFISIFKTFEYSISDNGFLLGMLIAISKLFIAIIVSILAISLIKYLFKDDRKLGHVFIFTILLGAFTWVLNTLINGERVRELKYHHEQ